jgi:putative inorganic carbon (HCO3(-)) transporter
MLRSLFVISLLAAGFTGALWSRHVALLTYVWLALFRPIEWIWWDISFLRPSLLAGLLLLIPCLLTGQLPNVTHPLAALMWLFAGAVLVAQVATSYAPDWTWVDQFIRLALVCGLAITILNTRERLIHYVATIAGSLAFFSAKAGVVSMLGGGVQFSAGQAGSFIDNNGYALAIAMAIPLMWATSVNLRLGPRLDSLVRWSSIGAIPLSVFTIIGTMSRGGLVALGALATAFALLQRRRLLWAGALTVSAVLMFRYAPMPEGYLERVETIRTYDEVGERSAVSRFHFWQVAVVMARSNPLGVGLRQFERAYDDYDFLFGAYGPRRSVHSSHFQALAELGYLGLVVWLAMFAYALRVCLRIRYSVVRNGAFSAQDRRFYTSTATAFATSMVAFLVGGSFIALAINDLTWLTFAGVAALHRLFNAQIAAQRRSAAQTPARAAPVVPRRPNVA